MERWDFDCQKCGKNLGNAWYVVSKYYRCPQEEAKYKLLDEVYPFFLVDKEGNYIEGELPPKSYLKEVMKRIRRLVKEKTTCLRCWSSVYDGNNNLCIEYYYQLRKLVWHLSGDDSYYKKAGIKKHEIRGRGRGRMGYCFCLVCAKELDNKCDVCGSTLKLIDGRDHKGGEWGIIEKGKVVREPAPMSSW